MTSKTAADAKRAVIPRGIDRTKEFIKDWDRENAGGRSKMPNAKAVMLMLVANEGPLPAQYKDHPLKGERAGYRACHVHGDFVDDLQAGWQGQGRAGGFCPPRLP